MIKQDEQPGATPTLRPLANGAAEPMAAAQPADKASAELTPFMRQWTAAKRENPDALLFFRMGDFYELFYDDAVVVSRELQLTLTARDRERNQPMCGVPYHAVENYLARLLRKGYRIAICDQMEDPKLTKKIVRREVTRVLSPGTALDTTLGQEQNNFLAALLETGRDVAARCVQWLCWMFRRGSFGPRSFTARRLGSRRWTRFFWRARARCCWPRVRSYPRSWNRFRRERGWKTGSGRATSQCPWWSGN